MAPMWDRIDPLAEKYYGISPYTYCGGDPVNNVDKDGRWIQCAIGAAIGAVIEGGASKLAKKAVTSAVNSKTAVFCSKQLEKKE